MSYQALARKYRPQTFRDVLGQEPIVRTLTNAIEQNRIHHAYLFSGVRGIGKTTTARILAKAINCVEGPTADPCNRCTICREITEGIDLDVREIDAATYTQVDNIRELREVSQFQPARDRRRIFIIDEAHMLSNAAWNALLKIIEEPPPHVVFMMATTEMQKVPATILSRVQQLVYRKITREELTTRLEEICQTEGIEAERGALEILAQRGEGSVRDSLSLLDQIIAFSGRSITAADVMNILGLADDRLLEELARLIHEGDAASILERLDEAAESGRDFKLLFRDFLSYLRSLLLVSAGTNPRVFGGVDVRRLKEAAASFEYSEILRTLNVLLRDDEIISRCEHQRLAVEVALLKAATLPRLRSVESVLAGGGGVERSPAAAGRQAAAAPKRMAAPAETGSEAGDDPLRQIVERVSAERRMTGSYLAQARSSRIDGSSVVFEYTADQAFVSGFLAGEQLELVRRIAGEVIGAPIEVKIETVNQARAAASPKEKGAGDDPIIQSFARHLGGEVVAQSAKEIP
jgi:DNA polymerase III subunit gamma/tau